MDSSIFFGGSAVAAMLAGTVALFAPCCISVMLPAYFASAFQNRRLLVAMTFLFAAGVAAVILPIALGAALLQRVFIERHTVIYVVGGAILIALAVYTLLGGKLRLPMPGRRAGRRGPAGVFTLGAFSGIASACCAPVLAGVIALSSVASSFAVSVGLGAAYVFGMVAPLFLVSLLWDRFDWQSSRLFRPRAVSWRIGPIRRTVAATGIASGVLLLLMGGGMLYIGLAEDAMPSGSGWQADISSELQHYGSVATDAVAWIPGWAGAILIAAIAALLARVAFRQLLGARQPPVRSDPTAGIRQQADAVRPHDYV
ncbi:MAG: cytochrome c biogenesis protein CcdA [Solirubrobacteraceae bacterium]